jgi:hypothetical protein
MEPEMSAAAWQALDELYQAQIEGSSPIRITPGLSNELQEHGLAVELRDGTLEITLAGSKFWEERQRLGRV